MTPLLEIKDLKTHFYAPDGIVKAVDGVTLDVLPGEMVGLVGESGCGKSVTSLSIMGLLHDTVGRIVSGNIRFQGQDLATKSERELKKVRGNRIAMIFQEPMTSLNPVLTIGFQLSETLRVHTAIGRRRRTQRAIELLELVGLADPHRRVRDYPHQLSGGMRQRVMIAMGLACDPDLLIADEPTTALDVTIQAQILELLADLQQRMNMGVVLITHNLGLVAEMTQRLVVMYAGKIVERAPTRSLFAGPRHPYTIGLLESIPQLSRPRNLQQRLATIDGMVPHPLDFPEGCRFHPRCPFATKACRTQAPVMVALPGRHEVACRLYQNAGQVSAADMAAAYRPQQAMVTFRQAGKPLLDARHLVKYFNTRSQRGQKLTVQAVQDISLSVKTGETLGVVGESGCGKTTLGKLIVGLEQPTAGEIHYRGESLLSMPPARRRAVSRHIQMVFQDPFSSLDPRMTVRDIIAEGLDIHQLAENKSRKEDMIAVALSEAGLQPEYMNRYPHEFSGGQRQRIGIARALVMSPQLIICDEPVSALDVSIQAQIINLLQDLQAKRRLSYLFVAHDLSVVRHISDRVMVMYLGRVMESGPTDTLFESHAHPYTQALLSAVPSPDLKNRAHRIVLTGDVPSPLDPPAGCPFQTRCPQLKDHRCQTQCPPLVHLSTDHQVACWHYSG